MSILHQVPTETKIKSELKKVIFGKKLFCPRCGSRRIKKYEGRYRCKHCRKPFSLKSVCWLKGMKLSLRTFWLLLWCWVKKVPLDQTAELCGVSKPTVRRWYERFRCHIPVENLSSIRLSGIVQMDEAYKGGKKKGYSIIGAKQKAENGKRRKMAFEIISKSSVDRKDALDFISQRIKPDSRLHTDGCSIYKGIDKWWRVEHSYERHNKWEFALTSEIEGVWGNLTTFIRRVYHHVTRAKIPEVLQEFQARQVYPEWFRTPSHFLEVAIQPLPKITRKPGRPKMRELREKMSVLSIPVLPNQLTYVPS